MNNKKKTGLIVLIIIIVIAVLCAAVNLFALKDVKKDKTFKKHTIGKEQYIAELHIEGTIQKENNTYNQEWLLNTIDELKKDDCNKAIAIFINSPGGTVYEADEAYLALQDYKTTGKPVYVYQGQMAASGGYYISCAADKIYANRNTLTGSIGVIAGSSVDLTGLMNTLGIKSETIHAGANKNMFNYNEPVTPDQRKIMQSIADECYDQFTSIVAMRRNLSIKDVKLLADGRIYSANQALKNGLIDKIGSWDNMIDDLCQDKFDGKHYKVVEISYEKERNLKEMLFGKSRKEEPAAEFLSELTARNRIQYPAYLYE